MPCLHTVYSHIPNYTYITTRPTVGMHTYATVNYAYGDLVLFLVYYRFNIQLNPIPRCFLHF